MRTLLDESRAVRQEASQLGQVKREIHRLRALPHEMEQLRAQINALRARPSSPDAIQETPQIISTGQVSSGPIYLPGVKCGPGYDNGPLIQAFAEGLQGRGGTIWLPPCDIYYSTPLELEAFRDVIFQGAGGKTAGAASATRLIYYGPAVGEEGAINAGRTAGVDFRDMQLLYTTNLEGGFLLNYQGAVPGESAYGGLRRVFIGGNLENSTCGTLVNLEDALAMTMWEVNGQFAQNVFRGNGASEATNGNGFVNCVFANIVKFPVIDPGEAWTFFNPVVEALSNGEASFVSQNEGVISNALAVFGGWMGDVKQPANAGEWFRFSGNGLVIIGAEIGGGAALARLGEQGPVQGFVLTGCHCNSQTNLLAVEASTEHSGWNVSANHYINTGPCSFQAGGTLPNRSVIDNPKQGFLQLGTMPQHEGPVSDASFGIAPPDGTYSYDFINHTFNIRSGGIWRKVALA